jgi:multiple sugar transport system substrate-binding protein
MWGAEPYMPSATAEMGMGNGPASGKIAMVEMPSWFLCCMGDQQFDFGAMPIGLDGKVAGRVDADTFRIWKGTQHPAEAFEVLTFLIGPVGTEFLVVSGTTGTNAAYGGFPALPEYQQPFLDAKAAQYPFVTTWDVILGGLAYPDVPSAEGYMPNWNEAWARLQTFGDLMYNTGGLDLATEIATLETDMGVIFNK